MPRWPATETGHPEHARKKKLDGQITPVLREGKSILRPTCQTATTSLASDGVGDALLHEAVLGCSRELLAGGGRVTGFLSIGFAFLHEARQSGARQLLAGRLCSARRSFRRGASRNQA